MRPRAPLPEGFPHQRRVLTRGCGAQEVDLQLGGAVHILVRPLALDVAAAAGLHREGAKGTGCPLGNRGREQRRQPNRPPALDAAAAAGVGRAGLGPSRLLRQKQSGGGSRRHTSAAWRCKQLQPKAPWNAPRLQQIPDATGVLARASSSASRPAPAAIFAGITGVPPQAAEH